MINGTNVKRLRESAKKVLYGNMRKGVSSWKQEYFYVCPSLGKYPHQWFWDSCFHVIALRQFDVKLAKKEILSLLSVAKPNGFLPHIIYWEKPKGLEKMITRLIYGSEKTSQLINPPIISIAIEKIFEKDSDKSFLEKTLPAVESYFRWLKKNRGQNKNGLISVIHPWETGADEKPIFDKIYQIKKPGLPSFRFQQMKTALQNKKDGWTLENAMNYNHFYLKDVGLNTLFAQSLRSLSKLFRETNIEDKEKEFETYAQDIEKELLAKCFNPDKNLFFDVTKNDRKLNTPTCFSVLPIILDNLPSKIIRNVIEKHILNPIEFWLPYGIPSVPKNDPNFNPGGEKLLWRGPVFINVNWLIFNALKKWGYKKEAQELREKTVNLVLKSDFREFYNPLTGEGLGEKNYGWSTLVADMLED